MAKRASKKIKIERNTGVANQKKIFYQLIQTASQTLFGKDHHFSKIQSYKDFANNVPIYDYEKIKPYIEKIIAGGKDILWTGYPLYFAKTSGTTSGIKYIPISKESIHNHMDTARNMIFNYCVNKSDFSVFDGKLIFLSGSPILSQKGKIKIGRLSGIVNHHIPKILKRNQLPTYKTNCIEDWEEKIDAIIDETSVSNMTLISGIPPWMIMYFERLIEKTGKRTIKEIFPNLKTVVHGGVNFELYSDYINQLIGGKVDYLETYPASEGFIAFQDTLKKDELLLNTNFGIFYEFIPLDDFLTGDYERITIESVQKGVNYVILLSTNAGLWAYNIGDTVEFVSLDPYKIIVTGRVEHFISAFGEHVIVKEVEKAIKYACKETGSKVKEFTVAPFVSNTKTDHSYHEWFIEFITKPKNRKAFIDCLENSMCSQNIYYKDLIDNKILTNLKIQDVEANGFVEAMKSRGKLGGQNKPPKIKNDRSFVEYLEPYIIKVKKARDLKSAVK